MHIRATCLLFFLLVLSARLPVSAQLEITAVDAPFTVDFDLDGNTDCSAALPWSDNITLAHCYADRPTYNYSNGCANIGGLHIAGSDGETALGGRSSNSMSSFRWGVRFKNSTGVPLSGLRVRVRSEQWGQAVSDSPNVVSFGYRSSSSPITDVSTGLYQNEAALNLTNFTAPSGCSGANSALDGNSPAYSALLEACLPVTLEPGDEIMLRWSDVNDPCNDHMLCVDDLEVTGLPSPRITADGPYQLCEGDTVALTILHPSSVQWNTGTTGPLLLVTEPGVYTATCTSSCGNTITISQEVIPAETATISILPGDTLICSGTVVELTALANVGGLVWSTGDTTNTIIVEEAGTYTVTAMSSCGTAQAVATLTSGDVPEASIAAPGGTTVCDGTELALTASGGTDYLWSTGQFGALLIADTAGTYTVSVSNACGTDEAAITIIGLQEPRLYLAASSEVLCVGDSIALTATGDGPFAWNTGSSDPEITITVPGTYVVSSTNECGSSTSSVTITDGGFNTSFTATPVEGIAPLMVNAVATSPAGSLFSWDTDNGASPTAPAINVTYTEPGTYTIILSATDPNTGCASVAFADITVLPGLSWVRMPNVFTPNGDGMNDALGAEYEALTTLDCVILNRWGQEVGHLKHPDDIWPGRSSDGLVPEGTYYYVLHAEGMDGRSHDIRGTITLLR